MNVSYDLHAHTHLSLCAKDIATIKNYVKSAKRNNLKLIGLSDHMWDKDIPLPECMNHTLGGTYVIDWYKTQTIEYCRKILTELENTDTEGINFIFGGEVDYCVGVGAAITPEHAEQLDFMIVPNSHTHQVMDKALYEPYSKHAEFMLKATMEICTAPTAKYVTSLAHPFAAVCCPYPVDYIIDTITDEQLIEVFSAAAENNIAAEINAECFPEGSDIKNNGLFRVLQMAKKAGCRFTFGSDSHSANQDHMSACGTVADLLGLSPEDVLFYKTYPSTAK